MAQFDVRTESLGNADAWPDRCARCGMVGGTRLIAAPHRFARKTGGLMVPLCPAHVEDWAAVGFRTRVAVLVWLSLSAALMFTIWTFHDRIARPNEQNDFARWSSTLFFGLVAPMPVLILLALWARSPIRVVALSGNIATVAGVCKEFARSMVKTEAAVDPEDADVPRFEVHPYSPQPVVPAGRAGNALGILFVLAAVLGSAVGLGGLEIQAETAGWDRNDWRFAALGCGIILAYTLPLIGLRLLASRFGCVIVGFIVILALMAFGVTRIAGSVRFGFSVAFTLAPLVLLQFLSQRLIWRWKLRSAVVAVAAGSGSALTFAAFALLLGGLEDGPHRAAFVLGPLVAFSSAIWSRSSALSPFCEECDDWLTDRRIGAFSKSIGEMNPIVANGLILALANVKPYSESAVIGDVELKAYSCTGCREQGTVVLELYECAKGGKNGTQPVLKRVGRWQYPGSSLPALEALFPPPAPPEDEQPPPLLDSNPPAD